LKKHSRDFIFPTAHFLAKAKTAAMSAAELVARAVRVVEGAAAKGQAKNELTNVAVASVLFRVAATGLMQTVQIQKRRYWN
jgi:hypothetical protein